METFIGITIALTYINAIIVVWLLIIQWRTVPDLYGVKDHDKLKAQLGDQDHKLFQLEDDHQERFQKLEFRTSWLNRYERFEDDDDA